MNNRSKGKTYEQIAKVYLEKNNVKILEMNYQGSLGEIDIIGYDGVTLVFFEVKYRKNINFGMPQDAINKNKRRKIYLTAREFIKKNRLENEAMRFDAIIFLGEKIEWLKNIFWGDELGL